MEALDCRGVCLLAENIKRGRGRLDIARLESEPAVEPVITGGCVFKRDRLNPGEKGFRTARGIEFAFEEPKERNITPAQAQWLTNFVQDVENAIFSRQFSDLTNGDARYFALWSPPVDLPFPEKANRSSAPMGQERSPEWTPKKGPLMSA